MIYCVEDDASIRELVLYTLRASGFEARGFAESGAFWEAMCEHVPDLVLLDIMLPGEDGLEILKKNNPCRLNHPMIGEVLASSCNDTKGALPFLSAALLDLTVTHMQIVMGYLNIYCKQKEYENALLLLDWALAFYPGLKYPQKRSYLDKSEAALWALRAEVLWHLERQEEAADSLRTAKAAAAAFDREPNYDARSIRFVSAEEAATAYDDLGSTAMAAVDTILADSNEPELTALWRRIRDEA